jgi:hypothetical protein
VKLEPCEEIAYEHRCWGKSSFVVWVGNPVRQAVSVCGKHVTKAVTTLGQPGEVVSVLRPAPDQGIKDSGSTS